MTKAIFLDRDGVINDNTRKHVNKPEDLIIYPGVGEALRKAEQNGFDLFVVTNQGGIELGHLTHEKLEKIHDKMLQDLEPFCHIREVAYCPDFKKPSECRKPKPGMILELAEKYDIDLKESWMVGDLETDVQAGVSAGCRTAKIGNESPVAEVSGKDLQEVIDKIMNYN